MAGSFNPLDPFGLFKKSNGGSTGDISFIPGGKGHPQLPPQPRGLPAPPDPLGLFTRRPYRDWTHQDGASPNGTSGATIGNPVPIEWAADVLPAKNEAREILISKGYSVRQVDMALHWGEEWLMGMARRMAPNNSELQKTVVVSGYKDISSRAERWLQGITNFAAAGGK